MTSTDDVESNLSQVEKHAEAAAAKKAKILFLPENALYMRLVEGEKITGFPIAHTVFERAAKLAQHFNLAIHLGSTPVQTDGKLYNASVFCEPGQKPKVTYKKIHLFDISLENQKPIRESDQFTHGPKTEVLHFQDWSLGQSICYDMRFAELYSAYAKLKVDAILAPSAFLVPTGKRHWEVLLRARAIESQAYVIAAAQAGTHKGKNPDSRETYGHSIVVDPWGEVLALGSADKPETLVVELAKSRLQQVRRQIPMKDHRRL